MRFGIAVAVGLAGALLCGPVLAAERTVPQSEAALRYSFSPIVKRVSPAVVNVYASRVVEQRASPFMDDPFFRRFFGGETNNAPRKRVQQSLGSGVIVDTSGIVVTNYHVIANADEVKVALSDKRELEAEVVLKDERMDLAVLRLKGGDGQIRSSPMPIPMPLKSAISYLRSATPSASARRSPAASSRRWRAPRSARRTISSSSRPTRLSIRAIPAAPSSTWTAGWLVSTPQSIRAAAARSASDSRFHPTWYAWLFNPH